jgi:hypothetical protein
MIAGCGLPTRGPRPRRARQNRILHRRSARLDAAENAPRSAAGLASATHEKNGRYDRRKGKADDKKRTDDTSPLATTTVIDGIVMG